MKNRSYDVTARVCLCLDVKHCCQEYHSYRCLTMCCGTYDGAFLLLLLSFFPAAAAVVVFVISDEDLFKGMRFTRIFFNTLLSPTIYICIAPGNPLSYFSFQPVLHDWCNKGRGMCYPVCGMVHIKEPLLLIGKSSLCGGSGFPLSLSEWSLTICMTPYNRR